MYSYQIVTPPTDPPLAASDLRDWLRTSDTSEDDLLADLIDAAQDKFTVDSGGAVLGSTIFKLYLDHWPTVYYDYRDQPNYSPWAVPFPYSPFSTLPNLVVPCIFIARRPVTEISTVEYLDQSGTWQALDGSTWAADTTGYPARVILPPTLPLVNQTTKPTVRVTFTAGYADPPSMAVQAVRLLAAHWYTNREAFGNEMKELPAGWLSVCKRFSTGVSGDWNR
ncbi:hypothetical protein [Fimbriiglobus ruber]|uniref:Phage protein n=1 Tax=Fimbriiglobus ruber TaxID=1908690 RepID=A0A225DAA5_9BACT|nr:hypothetical protein [Fimbriiglobus ruber]OWK37893.1 hypothetical protein FRUB_07013 [Fimbriiglobus ruber]